MDLTTTRADTRYVAGETHDACECEVSAVREDSFSEGGIYPLRAFVMVAAVAMVVLAFVR